MQLVHAIAAFLDEQRGLIKPATLDWYAHKFGLLSPLNQHELSRITALDLRKLWQACNVRMAAYTSFMNVVAWRRLFAWCVQRGLIDQSPACDLRRPRLADMPPKAISTQDMLKMLGSAQSHSARDYAIICLLIDTGCRACGIVGLMLDGLDLDHARATVNEKGWARGLHMKRRTVNALRAWLRVRDIQGSSVFGMGYAGLYQMLERTARRARVVGRSNPHSFRHGFARGMLNKGADLATVSQLMGHRSVDVTTRFYARWADEELHRKHQQYSWLPD